MLQKHSLRLLRIVLCAALLAALAPVAGHLFASMRNQQVVELCTSFGFKKVVLITQNTDQSPSTLQHDGPFCGFCLGGHAPDVFTQLRVSHFPLAPLVHIGNVVAQDRVTSQVIWPASQPRAPPQLQAV